MRLSADSVHRPIVAATSADARAAIDAMVDLTLAGGAHFHPLLEIRERDGDMSLHADAPDGEALVRLPTELLVPIDEVEWDVADDCLSIVLHAPSATSMQRELADAHVALYNATGKMRWARSVLPGVALVDDPAATAAVRLLRPGFASTQRPVAEAFISTRVFMFNRKNNGEDESGDRSAAPKRSGRVLMPVIDLVNHHQRAPGFAIADEAMTVQVAHSAGDSQCFVRYAPAAKDPLDLALGYGYVDPTAPLARSAPITVEVDGLSTVEITGLRSPSGPERDFPQVTMTADRLCLSHVTFSPRHLSKMMGALQMAVAAYLRNHGDPNREPASTAVAVVMAVAEANLELLNEANEHLATSNSPVARLITEAVDTQRRIIEGTCSELAAD